MPRGVGVRVPSPAQKAQLKSWAFLILYHIGFSYPLNGLLFPNLGIIVVYSNFNSNDYAYRKTEIFFVDDVYAPCAYMLRGGEYFCFCASYDG